MGREGRRVERESHDQPMTHMHMYMCMCMHHTHMCMSLHVLLYPHGAQERGCTACVRSVLLSGWSGCRAVSAAVRPLCAVGLSGSCQAVTLGPGSDGAPLMSDSAVRLSDTCCQAVEKVLSALSGCRALSGAVRGLLSG